jgi:hypothetical protein
LFYRFTIPCSRPDGGPVLDTSCVIITNESGIMIFGLPGIFFVTSIYHPFTFFHIKEAQRQLEVPVQKEVNPLKTTGPKPVCLKDSAQVCLCMNAASGLAQQSFTIKNEHRKFDCN